MSGDSSFMLLLRLGFSLAFVLGLIWCAAWVVRRRNGAGGSVIPKLGRHRAEDHGPRIEIVERRSVGRHSSVAVVRVGGQSLLVGITEQQIRLLHELGPAAEHELRDSRPHIDTTIVSSDELVEVEGEPIVLSDDVDLTTAAAQIQTEARRTGPHGTAESRSPRMNLVDAMRELTVRRT